MNLASLVEDVKLLINDVDYEKDRANARHILERSYRSHELGGGSRDDFLCKIVAGSVRSQALDYSASAILLSYLAYLSSCLHSYD
jgi:Ni,Fe-hydrogenase III large subunit